MFLFVCLFMLQRNVNKSEWGLSFHARTWRSILYGGDFWRREHHGMFLSRVLKWYWGKIISPETKSRDLYSSRNIISNPKILGTFRDVPDNKVAICYIVWLPIALPGFGIARRNLQNSVFFSAGISFKLCAVQCRIHCTVRHSATRIHCTVRAIKSQCAARTVNIHVWSDSIASSVCHLFAVKKCVVSISVPPPQLWGGQHTEMFVDHVTVFSQSVSHIRLSHTNIRLRSGLIWVGPPFLVHASLYAGEETNK